MNIRQPRAKKHCMVGGRRAVSRSVWCQEDTPVANVSFGSYTTASKHYRKPGLCKNESGQQVKAVRQREWGKHILRMMFSHYYYL